MVAANEPHRNGSKVVIVVLLFPNNAIKAQSTYTRQQICFILSKKLNYPCRRTHFASVSDRLDESPSFRTQAHFSCSQHTHVTPGS